MNEKKKKHCSIFKANKIKQYGCKIIENLRIVRKIQNTYFKIKHIYKKWKWKMVKTILFVNIILKIAN